MKNVFKEIILERQIDLEENSSSILVVDDNPEIREISGVSFGN